MPVKFAAKFCSVAALALLVCAALGPANWVPRSGLGWQFDHFFGYLAITCLICFAWPRPFWVGGALMTAAVLLEALQAFTPDRTADLVAACCGAGGALTAALVAELFIFIRIFIRAQWVAWAQPVELGTKSALPDY
jgi:VanZ family protein